MTTPTTLAEAIAAEENGKGSLRLVDGEPVWTDAPPRFQRRTNPTPVANPEVSALDLQALGLGRIVRTEGGGWAWVEGTDEVAA